MACRIPRLFVTCGKLCIMTIARTFISGIIFCMALLFTANNISIAQDGDILFARNADNDPQVVLDMLRGGNGRMLYLMCDETVRSAISVEQLSSLWEGLESQMGVYCSNGEWHDLDGIPGGKWCNLSFGNGKAALVIVYGTDGKIAGLQIAPPLPEPVENISDIYRLADGWEEKDLSVHTGRFNMPGKLTLPSSAVKQGGLEGIPVLILVHGSGPNDMDETLGPNRMFKELAAALSHKGIAVLRYDKRTYTYGEDAFADPSAPTVEEECTDDALSAALLADSLGFREIFIAGHSLGAGMAPYIATQGKSLIDGIIMLAAPASTMRETIEHQLETLSGFNPPEELDKIRRAFDDIPQCYIDGVDYDKSAVMSGLCKEQYPMLFLQGERDYQVLPEELGLWKTWVDEAGGNANTAFISYPGLNHIFHEGEGEPSPAEYAVQGRIPAKVIDDIAGFILAMP